MWNAFALALRLLTVLPPLSSDQPSRIEAKSSVVFLPAAGAVNGLIAGIVWMVASLIWTGQPMVAAALALISWLAVGGGRPLGGFARALDAFTALVQGSGRANALAVSREVRRGTSGTIATAAMLLLRFSFLAALDHKTALQGVVAAGVIGGWATAFGWTAFPVTPESDGETAHCNGLIDAGANEFLGATVLAIIGAAILPIHGLIMLVAAACVVAAAAQLVSRSFGGFNPSLCLALAEVAEVMALAVLTIK